MSVELKPILDKMYIDLDGPEWQCIRSIGICRFRLYLRNMIFTEMEARLEMKWHQVII